MSHTTGVPARAAHALAIVLGVVALFAVVHPSLVIAQPSQLPVRQAAARVHPPIVCVDSLTDASILPATATVTCLRVPGASGGADISLPVVVLRGAQPGPTLAVTAGVHGAEHAPQVAAQRLRTRIDVANLRGTVRLVLLSSPNAFFGRSVYSVPSDSRNLNRSFPGRAEGSEAERIASVLFTRVLTGADVILDLHAGDANEALDSYIAAAVVGDSLLDARTLALASASEFPQIILARRARTLPPYGSPLTLTGAAATLGVPSLATESGELGKTDEGSISRHVRAVHRIMEASGMMVRSPLPPLTPARITIIESAASVAATADGFWYPSVHVGQRIVAGAPIGRIVDIYARQVAELVAPASGRVVYLTATPPVRTGESIAYISVNERRVIRNRRGALIPDSCPAIQEGRLDVRSAQVTCVARR